MNITAMGACVLKGSYYALALLLFSVQSAVADPNVSGGPSTERVGTSKETSFFDSLSAFRPQLSEFATKEVEKYTAEIAAHPESAEAYLRRANVYSLNFPDKAIPDLSRALKLDPTNFSALVWRAKAYTRTSQFDLALADYSAAIKVKADSDACCEQGVIYHYNLKNPQQALPFYNASIGLDPHNSRAIACRGKAELELGLYDKALNDLTKAIELNPREWGNYMYRANVYEKLGNKVKAAEDRRTERGLQRSRPIVFYTQFISECPGGIGLYFLLADRQMYEKQYQGALDTLTHIITATPNAAEAYYLRGQCWEKLHSLEKAIEDYSVAVKLDPTGSQANRFETSNGRSTVYEARASLLYTLSRNKQAIDDYTVAVTLDPTNMSAWLGRGSVNAAEGHLYQSVADKTQALKLAPTNPTLWMARALTFDRMHQYEKAWSDFNQAIEIMRSDQFQRIKIWGDPKRQLAEGYRHRGITSLKLGRKRDASADFSRAIAIHPAEASEIESDLRLFQR